MSNESAVSRRELLKRLGLAGVGILALPELSRVLSFRQQLFAQTQVLSAAESATLTAICARIIPTDQTGPGAVEAHAATYIERALGGWLAPSRADYAEGLAAVDQAARAKSGTRFAELAPAEQDAVLTGIEETPFFALVRTHTLQGTFCDPAYGGNANFVGWDLIGYPGVRLNVTAADQRMSEYAKPVRRSAYEYAMFANTMGATNGH
jgi:gluconate 2-dehydrogenase gamma chain